MLRALAYLNESGEVFDFLACGADRNPDLPWIPAAELVAQQEPSTHPKE
jgi:hypothetical protein